MVEDSRRWFVYVLMDGSVPIYIGKGQKNRHLTSQKRHGGEVHILKRFRRETDALKYEKKMIAEHKPQCNKTAGGEGRSRVRRLSNVAISNRWIRDAIARARCTESIFDSFIARCYMKAVDNEIRDRLSVCAS